MLDILKVFITIVLLYFGYQLILKHTGFLEKSAPAVPAMRYTPPPAVEDFQPEPVPVIETPKPLPVEHRVAASGPNPPAQQGPEGVRHIIAQEQPTDPYAEMQEDAYAPEKLRHPERMFRPAPENDTTSIASQSGIASTLNAVPQNIGVFAPEMAQNGGYFMGDVAANDLTVPTNYSEY